MHWQFDPILFQLGPVAIHWYGLLFVGAFVLGERYMERHLVSRGHPAGSTELPLMAVLLGTVLGARLVHVFFYEPSHFLSHPLDILKVWQGGLASHGGVMGFLLGLWWGCRKAALPLLTVADLVAVPAAFGGMCVRLANFLNSEIVGEPTTRPWGVIFDRLNDGLPRHPVQLYEAFGYLASAVVLWLWQRRSPQRVGSGFFVGAFLTLIFSVRVVAEIFKTPQAEYEQGMLISTGQWLSLPFLLTGIALMVWRRKP